MLGKTNFFASSIEWHKHQNPETWIEFLKEAGFDSFKLKWIAPSKFGKIGNFLFGNRVVSFFYNSHFIIFAKKC